MRVLAAISCMVIASGVAHADLDADKDKKKYENDLADAVKAANAKCGGKLAASYDWKSEVKVPPQSQGMNVGLGAGLCERAVVGVDDVCDNHPEAKKTVASKVKKVRCKFDAGVVKKKSKGHGVAVDLAGEPAVPHAWVELSKGTLDIRFDWRSAGENLRAEVAKYLTKEL